jgi:hypothetical protein
VAKRKAGPTLIQQSRRKSPAEKAAYHHVAGAGRSRVKREFFDVSDSELGQVRTLLSNRLKANLARAN